MAFVIKKEKSYIWPCTISEPKDGGGFDDFKISIKFKMLSQARIDQIIRNESEEDDDILMEVVMGWDENQFKDDSGAVIAFNDENLRAVLSVPYVRGGLLKGFFTSIAGKAVKRKN
jgi:hypothetical protein